MDVPDTDISVVLYEILPDGRSVQLTSDSLRARYQGSTREAKLVTAGQITQYNFDSFTWFPRRVSKGTRPVRPAIGLGRVLLEPGFPRMSRRESTMG